MSYEVTLLVFGILLLLVGLVGKVKAKELEVGTSSAAARIVTGSLGVLLIVFSLNPDIPRAWLFDSPATPPERDEPAPPDPVGPEDGPDPVIGLPVQVVRVGTSASGVFNSHGFVTPRGRIVAFGPTTDRTSYAISWTEGTLSRQGTVRVLDQRNDNGLAPFLVLLALPEGLDPGPAPRLRNASSLRPGDAVERYLSPNDRTPGEVYAATGDGEPLGIRTALVTSSISGPGDAGAPVLDADGRLVGIVIGGSAEETFSIPIETVRVAFPTAF